MSSIPDISLIQATCKNQAREQEIRRKYGYRAQDYVTIHTLPKGQMGKKYVSQTYHPRSARANRLQQQVYALRGKLNDAVYADLPRAEKAKKIADLKQQLKCANIKLSSELHTMPKVGIIVLDDEA